MILLVWLIGHKPVKTLIYNEPIAHLIQAAVRFENLVVQNFIYTVLVKKNDRELEHRLMAQRNRRGIIQEGKK
jgi:hypothetical protein